jgi:hypothetical protein
MRRLDLVPDCGSCAAICCVATSFETSEDFALDKPAGVACRHLTRANLCSIHDDLVRRGFAGCAIYDCYGAGQRATRAFAGAQDAELLRNDAFLILRGVHEHLWLLTEAAKLCPESERDLRSDLARTITSLDGIARDPAHLREVDLEPHLTAARVLLRRVGDALGGRAFS